MLLHGTVVGRRAAAAGTTAVRHFGHAHPHPKHKPITAPHKPRVTQLLIDGKVCVCTVL
jgi:hypothetical protein